MIVQPKLFPKAPQLQGIRFDLYFLRFRAEQAQLQHGDLVLDELLLRMDADDEKAHHPGQQHAAQHGRPQRQQHLAQREPLSS